jgi:hypothetical protein
MILETVDIERTLKIWTAGALPLHRPALALLSGCAKLVAQHP